MHIFPRGAPLVWFGITSFVGLFAWLLTIAPAGALVRAEGGDFVTADGTNFVLGERPFAFVGANVAVVHGLEHREHLAATLDAVVRDGLTVVRVWALGESPAEAEPWRRDYAFRAGPDGWVEASFEHLDAVLVGARERGLRVVLVLANRWGDYGGFSEYARWAGQAPEGDDLTPAELARFYTCDACGVAYDAHLRRLVGRTNTLTGVPYAEDPTILSWELANELSANTVAAEEALLSWVRTRARAVRALDPNHLIGAGHIGYRTSRERRVWLAVHRLEEIGYVDSHAYPLRDPRVRRLADLRSWVDDRLQLAQHVLAKPFVWGEFGFRVDQARVHGSPRAAWFDAFLDQSARDGAAGALVWIYRPGARGDAHQLRPDVAHHARDVRAVLRRHARRFARRAPTVRNARLSAARGAEPLFGRRRMLRGRRGSHRGWTQPRAGQDRLEVPVAEFHRLRFESAGIHEQAPAHVWAAGEGDADYRIRLPRDRAANLIVIQARLSSEVPGIGGGGAGDDSSITLYWGDIEVGETVVPPDDGAGSLTTWTIEDEAVLRRIARGPRDVRLRLHASAARAGGLCLYASSPLRIFLER